MHAMPSPAARSLRARVGGVLAVVAVTSTTAGCGALNISPTGEVAQDITVASPVIVEGERIPERFTCHGDGISPPLQWSGFPADTESLAIVVDAPEAAGGSQVHWVVFNLDPQEQEIAEGVPNRPAVQAATSPGSTGYDPPCPDGDGSQSDEGEVYRFTVYALSSEIDLAEGAELADATDAIAERVMAYGRLFARA